MSLATSVPLQGFGSTKPLGSTTIHSLAPGPSPPGNEGVTGRDGRSRNPLSEIPLKPCEKREGSEPNPAAAGTDFFHERRARLWGWLEPRASQGGRHNPWLMSRQCAGPRRGRFDKAALSKRRSLPTDADGGDRVCPPLWRRRALGPQHHRRAAAATSLSRRRDEPIRAAQVPPARDLIHTPILCTAA